MKLTEIKDISSASDDLMEAVIPAHITLTLEKVIRDGKVTNNVQTFMMANLSKMFKYGQPERWPRDLNPYPMDAGSDMIEAVRSLTSEESVDLASWLLTELQSPEVFERNPWPCCRPEMLPVEWMRWVLRRQD